jgi:hypothetical protein
LTQIFYGTEHVLLSTSGVLNDFFDNNGFGEGLVIALLLNCLSSSVQKSLLSKAKSVGTRFAVYCGVEIPIVLTGPLLAGRVVGVCLHVHLAMFGTLFKTSFEGIKDLLSVSTVLSGAAESG